jgi:hypothetical protein
MSRAQAEQLREPNVQESDAPDLAAMSRRHERACSCYRAAAIAMAAGGLLVLAVGPWLPGVPPLLPLVTGPLLAALAALPWAQTIEQRERAQGLAVLEEEWRTLAADGQDQARQELLALIARLYCRPARG